MVAPKPAIGALPDAAAAQERTEGQAPVTADAAIEFRCPHQGGMFLKLLGTPEAVIATGNVIEVVCIGCRTFLRRQGQPVFVVRHRFSLLGELIDTDVIMSGRV